MAQVIFFMMRAFQILVLIGLTAVPGCEQSSSQYVRVPLEGTATLNGAPFEGSISLRPQSGTSGPTVNAPVTGGQFAFDERSGPVSGPHIAFLMPAKLSHDQESVTTDVTVPSQEPFHIELVVQTEPPAQQAAPGTLPESARSGK